MSDSLPNIDLSGLGLDPSALNAIAGILNYTESLIDPAEKPEDIAFLYNLKNQIVLLKGEKSRIGNGRIDVGVSEFKHAFYVHIEAAGKLEGISKYLLLFYAVECGLKAVWLKQTKTRTTARIRDAQTLVLFKQNGHNLRKWVKKLNISTTKVGETPSFRLARGGSSLDIEKAHQSWRYGVAMNSRDERVLVEWLEKICDWIKENIKK